MTETVGIWVFLVFPAVANAHHDMVSRDMPSVFAAYDHTRVIFTLMLCPRQVTAPMECHNYVTGP